VCCGVVRCVVWCALYGVVRFLVGSCGVRWCRVVVCSVWCGLEWWVVVWCVVVCSVVCGVMWCVLW
jgi:hypothetical protein